MQIVNFWYELARQNKAVKGFIYGRNGSKGAGNEFFPLTHLDDPILGQSSGDTLRYTCNVDILGIPDDDTTVQEVQAATFEVGLSYWQKTKDIKGAFRMEGFSFITLSEYTDNDAAGHRFTYTVISANPINKCIEYYDPAKQFPTIDALPDFKTDNPEGCAVFSEKGGLPNFKIDI
jgi:hypothetical protein